MTRCLDVRLRSRCLLSARPRWPNAPTPAQPPVDAGALAERELDELFARLAVATEDADESAGIVAAIDRINLRSGSETADLLMARARGDDGERELSRLARPARLDRRLAAGWAEGWNKRATARYLAGDAKGRWPTSPRRSARSSPSRRAGGDGNDPRRTAASRTGLARLPARAGDRAAMAPDERGGDAGEGRPRGSGAVTARPGASRAPMMASLRPGVVALGLFRPRRNARLRDASSRRPVEARAAGGPCRRTRSRRPGTRAVSCSMATSASVNFVDKRLARQCLAAVGFRFASIVRGTGAPAR